jgi:hypothetical protein
MREGLVVNASPLIFLGNARRLDKAARVPIRANSVPALRYGEHAHNGHLRLTVDL